MRDLVSIEESALVKRSMQDWSSRDHLQPSANAPDRILILALHGTLNFV